MKKFEFLELPRKTKILPKHINKTFKIYNGNKFKNILIKKDMVGYKFGHFSNTRAVYLYKKNKKTKK